MEGLGSILSTACVVVSAALLAYSYPTSTALARPVHSLLGVLICLTVLLYGILRLSIGRRLLKATSDRTYEALPLEEVHSIRDDTEKPPQRQTIEPLSRRSASHLLVGSAIALAVRIEVYRRVSKYAECSSRSVEVFIPLLLALYDARRFQQPLPVEHETNAGPQSILHRVGAFIRKQWLVKRWRYVPLAAVFCVGGYLISGLWDSHQSTYICPLLHRQHVTIPLWQLIGLCLDTFLGIAVQELALVETRSTPPALLQTMPWSIITGTASALWVGFGLIYFWLQPESRAWTVLADLPSGVSYFAALLWLALLFSCCCLSCLFSISKTGVLYTSMVLAGIFAAIPGVRFIWSNKRPYPPNPASALTWSFFLMYFGWSSHHRLRKVIADSQGESSTFWAIVRVLGVVALLLPGMLKSDVVHFHPIDLLMYDAQNQFVEYAARASASTTLQQAVASYMQTTGDVPPPGFDVWFEFAKNRSVLIVDEFDQIYNDLLPFRAFPPSNLREQTWEMVANPWNEIAGVKIRDGKVELQENVLPTHRWMVEGAATFISSFSQHLPDMDIAFNLNDESRVAVDYNELEELRRNARQTTFTKSAPFSTGRADQWKPMPKEAPSDSIFENWSFQNTFQHWGARGCRSSSKARSNAYEVSKSTLCIDCTEPHSMGQFVSNWSLAADPCHQPDLANLHGFYLAPAAFKTSPQLRPVFSQSKVHGFNDILYPSPWNYMDKVRYAPTDAAPPENPDQPRVAFPDPTFTEKDNTLFWRGASSEGVSPGNGTWQGMVRQRLVHMANNLTSSRHDEVTLLLPAQKDSGKYAYITTLGNSLSSLNLSTDIRFVDHVARCGGRDCRDQEVEFGLVPPSDFQSHWRYRYLFDLDGAGFSGRFLPFLQSRSLPFKTALFREWYDSRLTPWLHFVPQDLRLHDVWSTLAYFAGVNGTDAHGRRWEWEGHEKEAEIIAESGREWANRALTKADMEVYFFRLLLEWGRLTDDNRDNLGFTLPK